MANKQLILMRHGKSDWHSGVSTDFDRPLNRRGLHDVPRVGGWMHFSHLRPEVIRCSSAVRTRETLEGVSRQLDLEATDIAFTGELYHANETEIIEIVEAQLQHHHSLMIIGHNPGLELALLNYCPDTRVPDDGKLMTTSCIAVIEFDVAIEDAAGAGILKHHRRPD